MVSFLMLLLFLVLFVYGCYALWDTDQIYKASSSEQYEIYKPTEEESLSFDELVSINKDVFGWITVYGTNIDYPLVQTDNNETYVNTDVKGEYALSGSIFLDFRNKRDFSDFNSIIYGHHMEKEAMFGEIGNFQDETYFDAHKYGTIYVDGQEYGVEFFAYILADGFDTTIYAPGVDGKKEKSAYLNRLKEAACYWRELSLKEEDRIILLSTCKSNDASARQLLAGRISETTFPNAFAEKEKSHPVVLGSFWRDTFGQLPILVWSILVLALLIVAYEGSKRRQNKNASRGDEEQK